MSPYCCNKDNCGINCLDDNSQVSSCRNCVGCFDDSHDTCGNDAAGSLIHGFARREDEPFLFFWLLFILGNLFKIASRFVGCLTLLEVSNELERVSGHHLVQVHELELMHLGLREEKNVHSSHAPWVLPLLDRGSHP